MLWACALSAWAQTTTQPSAIERQRATLELQRSNMERQLSATTQQRTAVRRQMPELKVPANTFFTAGWTSEPMNPSLGASDASPTCDPVGREQMESMIKSNAEKNGLTPDVLRALIRQESAFYPCAVSSKGAMGLMQLMPGTAAELNVLNPFDPGENVRAGTQYLRQLLDRYDGDLVLALSAYNAGPSRVDAAGGVPEIKETKDYVNKILGDSR